MTTAQTAKPQGNTARIQSSTRFQAAPAIAGRGVDAIADGSFEAGASGDSPDWTETSTNFGTTLCTTVVCGSGGGTALPRTGTVWSWFGGASGGGESGTLTQPVTLNDLGTDVAKLEFYLWIGAFDASGSDSLTVTLGGDTLFTAVETDATYQAGYTLVSIDISSYDDGVERDLVFTGTDLAGLTTNISLDDVAIVIEPAEEETPEETPTPTEETPEETPTPTEETPEETPTPTEETPEETPTPTETGVAGVELIANGGFEDELTAWTVKKGAGDKVKCNKDTKVVANSGECAFKFKGGAGESTKLVQTVDLDALSFAAGDILDLSVFANGKKATANGKVKIVVKYSDSEDRTKLTASIGTTDGYEELTASETLLSSAVSKIKVQIGHKSPNGKVFVDDVSLVQSAGIVTLLPLP